MISVDDALHECLSLVDSLPTQDITLEQGLGRYMPFGAVAKLNQPPFDSSAMDGYAVCGCSHLAGASFRVIGEAGAGHAWQGDALKEGEALRIFTGAPVPKEAKLIIIQENVRLEKDKDQPRITLLYDTTNANHIRPLGQDFKAGDILSARFLGPSDLSLLAAMNISTIQATKRPHIVILPTGDELVLPGQAPKADQIIASTSYALKALCEKEGATATILPIVRDTLDDLKNTIAKALPHKPDLILTTGGASVGEHDLIANFADEIGINPRFWKVAMRPGKPLIAGTIKGTAMLGLPGNPASSFVCAYLFALPMIRKMLGVKHERCPPIKYKAHLTNALGANGPRTHYMRAHVENCEGAMKITVFNQQNSAHLAILSQSNALLVRPPFDKELSQGSLVNFFKL